MSEKTSPAARNLLDWVTSWWTQLPEDARNNAIGDLVAWSITGVLAIAAFVFRGPIWSLLKRVFRSAPPLPSPTLPRLPVESFITRYNSEGQNLVRRLQNALALDKAPQLVVLHGKGGVGKTALAAETVSGLVKQFRHIVWASADGLDAFSLETFLTEIATQTQLDIPNWRQQLVLPDQLEQAVRYAVAQHPTLLVLDNFETVAEAEQQRCTAWLHQCRCPALITSRWPVDSAHNEPIDTMTEKEATQFVTKRLWKMPDKRRFASLDRTLLFEVTERNPRLIDWVIGQMEQEQQFQTVLTELRHGKGEAAQRIFARSFHLPQLGDDGRATLLALALFVPAASRAALASVAGFADDERRLDQALRRLRRLRLIEATTDGRPLKVEGLTRDLARAELRGEQAHALRQRFVVYYLDYAKAHAQPIKEDFDVLEAEKDNLLGAMDVAFELTNWASVMALANGVLFDGVNGMLRVRGYWEEAVRCNERALAAARQAMQDTEIAQFAHNLAIMHQQRGEPEEARRLYAESLEINKRVGNQSGIAGTLHQLGWLAQGQGNLAEARRLYAESLEINKRVGDQSGIARTLHQLGWLAQDQGNLAEARRLYDESLEINKRVGNQSGIAGTLHQLGILVQDQGNLAEARRLYDESLEINKRVGDQSGIAGTLHQLGILVQDQGNLAEARRLYDESLEISKRVGDQSGIARTLHQLGWLAQDQGNLAEARRLYDESLEINKRVGDQHGIAMSLHQLGVLAEQEGHKAKATQLFREALTIFEKLKSPNAEIARRALAQVEEK